MTATAALVEPLRDRRPVSGHRGDLLAVAVLLALPALAFTAAAAWGHPVLPGDDLLQNYPLRVLVGQQVRHGRLPLLDPYLWGGAPLLGGWNAGAAYPLTWLFAVLAPGAAWTLNLIAVSWIAALGCYAYLRSWRLGCLPAFLGGWSFAFAGAMTAQLNYLGLVAGMAWVPWALLGAAWLERARSTRQRFTAAGLLAASIGLIALAGEPRAITDAAVVLVPAGLWRAWRARAGGGAARFLFWGGVSLAVGIALGAVQLLPGLATVATSQRAAVTPQLFLSGSLRPSWLTLLMVPTLLGGAGSFGAPRLVAAQTTTEITCYVGLVAIAAAASLPFALRRGRRLPEWMLWEIVAGIGAVLALGGHTPAWHLLIHIPLYGGERLQERNLMVVDLALAFLLAFWVQRWSTTTLRRRERLAAALPGAAVIVLVLVALLGGSTLPRWLGVTVSAHQLHQLDPVLAPSLVVAVALAVVLARGAAWRPQWRRTAIAALVISDVVGFLLTGVLAVGSPLPAGTTSGQGATVPGSPVPIAALHPAGRVAVFDPWLAHLRALNILGQPDLNVSQRVYSVQGYGSVVDGRYARATGTHQAEGGGQATLSGAAVAGSVLDALDTTDLFVPAVALIGGSAGPPGPGLRQLRPGSEVSWFLGPPQAVADLRVPGLPLGARAGVLEATGQLRWLPRGGWRVPVRAIAVVVTSPGAAARGGVPPGSSARVGPPSVELSNGHRLTLDGPLQGFLLSPHWRYRGQDGPFARYADTRAVKPLLLIPFTGAGRSGAAAGTITALTGPPVAPSAASVRTRYGGRVVRAGAAIPGWQATWAPRGGGPAVRLRVISQGVVQAVVVPAGTGTLRFRYRPPGLSAGVAISIVALLALLAVGIGLLWTRRRSGDQPAGTADGAA